MPKLKRVRGDHGIKLQVDGNGELHMEPESDDNEREDSYSCSSDSEETKEYKLDAKEKSSVRKFLTFVKFTESGWSTLCPSGFSQRLQRV